jgi:prepilin-type N-terminal cleavage/methylation domain-containing protein
MPTCAAKQSAGARARAGFTLVEILIVVVVLGILAAIVLPQFASATNDAIKSHLARNLQAVDHQIALYRAQHAESLPTEDPVEPMVTGGANEGWGVLVSANYLKEAPTNFYTSSRIVIEGDEAGAIAATPDSVNGWHYAVVDRDLLVYAVGYERATDLLNHERPGG